MVSIIKQIDKSGAYNRKPSAFRDFIEPGGRFAPEAGRYHLHVSLACPWACGTLSMLYMKGLDKVISHSIVHPTWARSKVRKTPSWPRSWANFSLL